MDNNHWHVVYYRQGMSRYDRIVPLLFETQYEARNSYAQMSDPCWKVVPCVFKYVLCPIQRVYTLKRMREQMNNLMDTDSSPFSDLLIAEYKEQKHFEKSADWYIQYFGFVPDQPIIQLHNGLVQKSCGKTLEESCSHYITTREVLNQTKICPLVRATNDEYVIWNDNATRDEIVDYLLHTPHCAGCLQHDNSYKFPAYYDISMEQVSYLAELYTKYCPENIQQPRFFPWGDRQVVMRLAQTYDSDDEHDGELDLDSMVVSFHVWESLPSFNKETGEEGSEPWILDSYMFDLKEESGWRGLFKVFPQKVRE